MDCEAWQKAIRKDSTEEWHHVNSIDPWDFSRQDSTDIYANYFVQGIPRYILINRNGVVTGLWCGGTEENYAVIRQQAIAALAEKRRLP